MDKDDRLVPLCMKASSEKLSFINSHDKVILEHLLSRIHIQSADSIEAKVVDTTGKFFGVKI